MKRKLLYLALVTVVMLVVFSIASSYGFDKSQSEEVEQINSGREYGYPTNIYTYEGESQEDNAVFDDTVK